MTYVPLVDPVAEYREVAAEIGAALAAVLESGTYVGGKPVDAFEQDLAALTGVRHCVGVGSGADAIELLLRSAGTGPGDEVVLPVNAGIATAEAILRTGARPVFADVEPLTHLIDPVSAVIAFGTRTRALVPVHRDGQIAPMEGLLPGALAAGVAVIEDAARSHGASRNGRPAGSFGLAAATSFAPGGNLGAYGDAGAVLTDDATVAGTVRLLANHGSARHRTHERVGIGSRLDAIQAAALGVQLGRLESRNRARQAVARRYDRLLAGLPGLVRPVVAAGNTHVWQCYVVEVDRRDQALERLRGQGIAAAAHDPVPLHLRPALAGLGYRVGAFPVAERAAARTLSLPMYPTMTADDTERVVAGLSAALAPGPQRRPGRSPVP